MANKTAVVTGAAHGIGKPTALLHRAQGARVIAVDVDETALEATFAGTDVSCVTADVADGAALGQSLLSLYGRIDLLVNNVGVETPRTFLQLSEQEFDQVFAVNLRGPWFLTRQVVADLVNRGATGSVVFVSSLHGQFVRTYPHYSASKAAVDMLVRELANELGPAGIRVNAVSPGAIHSKHVPLPEDARAERIHREIIPLGAVGEPDSVANMIVMLLGDEAGYVTGANVRVDGGLGTHSWSVHPE